MNVAYPVGDLVLLAILALVLVAAGWRTPAVRLLLAMLVCFLAGDIIWAIINQMGWPSEEFVLLLPDTSAANAEMVVSKLAQATPLGQTFSAGIVQWDGESLAEEFIRAADDAMYQAKRAGRNRTNRAPMTPIAG